MRRRAFVAGSFATASLPALGAPAPGSGRRLLGYLSSHDGPDPNDIPFFEARLLELGWLPDHVVVEYRFAAGSIPRMEERATELVGLHPDVLVGVTTPVSIALRNATRASRTPVVFFPVTDPVGSGLFESLARPGGNLTGFTSFEFSIVGKWISILLRVSPEVKRIGLMYNPATTATFIGPYLDAARTAAAAAGAVLEPLPVEDAAGIAEKLNGAADGTTGLVVIPDALTTVTSNARMIVDTAAARRICAMFPFDFFVGYGGLMSYGASLGGSAEQAANYVDRILNGADVAELPVQAPTSYELTLNLKTAKALGLTIPMDIMAEATSVRE